MKRRITSAESQPVEHLDVAAFAKLHCAASYLDAALKVDVNAGLADVRHRAGTSHPRPTGQKTQQQLTRMIRQFPGLASFLMPAYAPGIARSLLTRRTAAILVGAAFLAASVALISILSLGSAIAIPAAAGSLAGGFLISTLGGLVSEEAAQRLDRLPHTLISMAARRLPSSIRQETAEEWSAELRFLLDDEKELPLTRVLLSFRYAVGLLVGAGRIGRMVEAEPPRETGETPARRLSHRPRMAVTQGIVLTAIGAAIIIVGMASGKDTATALALVGILMGSIGVAALHESISSNGQKGA